MKRFYKYLHASSFAILCIFLCFQESTAQTAQKLEANIMATKAMYLGKSRPIAELTPHSTFSRDKKSAFKSTRIVPDNFRGRRGESKAVIAELEHQGPDLLRQTDFSQGARMGSEIFVNRDGVGLFGSPSDPSGEIGKDHYVMMVNVTEVGVYDKQGNFIQSFNANTLWSEFNAVSRGDPIVLYDEEFERWILTEFTNPANLLIAVSETSDPLGSYFAYTYQTPNFPDYPKYAIWSEALVVTTNEQGAGTLHSYFIERDSLMAGAEELNVQRVSVQGNTNTEAGFFTSTPVDWSGTAKPSDDIPITLHLNDSSWGGTAQDALELTTYDIDFRDENNSSVSGQSIIVSPYDGYPCSAFDGGFSCVPQKDGFGVDAIPEIVMNMPDYRNFGSFESIVYTFITDVTDGENRSGIRWGELRRTPGEVWEVYQEGTFSLDDRLNRFMPFISINADGDIGLAYSVSSTEDYVGLRFTGRLSDDPLGLMTFTEETIVDGVNQINGGSRRRYGDYGQLSVDPVDGKSFWFTSEWGGSGGSDSRNRIAAFRLTRDNIDGAVASLVSPETSSSLTDAEEISVLAFNRGVSDLAEYSVTLHINGTLVSTFSTTDQLAVGESRNIVFPDLADLSALGDYLLEVEITTVGDENLNNNTISKSIRHIANIDGSITLEPLASSCSDDFNFTVEITNNGESTLSSAQLEILLDGSLVETENLFFNELEYLESASRNISINDLASGNYDLSVNLVNLNQGTDEILTDNQASAAINQSSGAGLSELTIRLDIFPTETTWEIVEDGTNQLIASGGDYSSNNATEEIDVCLEVNSCYTFTIFDSYSDGISRNGMVYFLVNQSDTLFMGDGQFGDERSHSFCLQSACAIQASVASVDASSAGSNNGSITITPDGDISDFTYSIDGGNTFFDTNVFDNLSPATYIVVVRADSDASCTYTESVFIGPATSTQNLDKDSILEITPNPNEGYFNLNLTGYQGAEIFLNVSIFNELGQKVRKGTIARYGDSYTGPFSIMDQPAGNYFIQVSGSNLQQIQKMIKM